VRKNPLSPGYGIHQTIEIRRQTIGIINILVRDVRPLLSRQEQILAHCIATRTLSRSRKDSVFRMYDRQIVETRKPSECWIHDAKAFRLGLI